MEVVRETMRDGLTSGVKAAVLAIHDFESCSDVTGAKDKRSPLLSDVSVWSRRGPLVRDGYDSVGPVTAIRLSSMDREVRSSRACPSTLPRCTSSHLHQRASLCALDRSHVSPTFPHFRTSDCARPLGERIPWPFIPCRPHPSFALFPLIPAPFCIAGRACAEAGGLQGHRHPPHKSWSPHLV